MPKSATKQRAPSGGRSWLWLQGAVCGALVVLTPGTAILLATLMALSLVALVMQREVGPTATRAMLMISGATALIPLRHLWENGGTIEASLDVLSNPIVPLFSWASTGAAWFVNEVWFVVARHVMLTADDRAAKRLKLEREELVNEWRDVG